MKKKYFGTDGIRGKVGGELINPSFMLKLGWALGSILGNGGSHKVLIGKDTRISGYMLESALEAGLSAAGMDIHLLGPMTTPAVAYLTSTLRADAGVVISASHNPHDDNGIKFFSKEGFKLSDELEHQIELTIDKPMELVDSAQLGKAVRIDDATGRYIEFCKSTVPSHFILSGMKIVLDCAHGAAYHTAPHVLRELGADVIELGTDPDGLNINKNSGSTHPEVLQKIVEAERADVGIALDGDGDRVIMVDHLGKIVDGDELLYVIATYSKLQGGVVGTSMSNLGLELALKALDIPFKRAAVGDRFVMEMLKDLHWHLGGESSGHIVNLDLTTTGDGIVSALQVLCAMSERGKTLNKLKSGMQKIPQKLLNVKIKKSIPINTHAKMQKAIVSAEQELKSKGRVLLRASGTEPVIRVMVEGEEEQQINRIAEDLAETVREITA